MGYSSEVDLARLDGPKPSCKVTSWERRDFQVGQDELRLLPGYVNFSVFVSPAIRTNLREAAPVA